MAKKNKKAIKPKGKPAGKPLPKNQKPPKPYHLRGR